MRYSDIINEAFEINHRLIAYHATHEPQGLILKHRTIKSMDSMGTWLSSSKDMVTELFGPNVEAYELPYGRYIQARQNESIEVLLTNLPIIKQVFGDAVAQHMEKFPLNAANRKFLSSLSQRVRKKDQEARQGGSRFGYDHRMYLRYNYPQQLARWKALEQSEIYQREMARSSQYCQAFRELISRTYQGIVWAGNVGWDGWMKPVNIYLVFHDEDLKPILINT